MIDVCRNQNGTKRWMFLFELMHFICKDVCDHYKGFKTDKLNKSFLILRTTKTISKYFARYLPINVQYFRVLFSSWTSDQKNSRIYFLYFILEFFHSRKSWDPTASYLVLLNLYVISNCQSYTNHWCFNILITLIAITLNLTFSLRVLKWLQSNYHWAKVCLVHFLIDCQRK